jgi:mRNA interferase RelE/StbE
VTWAVEFHPLVRDQDLPALDRAALAPESYGERLRADLHGYWKLRVGEFRVIYEIRRNLVTVLVLKIGYRRDDEVYKQMSKRLRKL